jgi:hypothetical protein
MICFVPRIVRSVPAVISSDGIALPSEVILIQESSLAFMERENWAGTGEAFVGGELLTEVSFVIAPSVAGGAALDPRSAGSDGEESDGEEDCRLLLRS